MRCFLSIDLEKFAKKLAGIKLSNCQDMTSAKRYHITLVFWENLSESAASCLINKLNLFNFKNFHLRAEKIFAFPNKEKPELYALGFTSDSQLNRLHDELSSIINSNNLDKFNPHVTILRKEKLKPGFKESKELVKKIMPLDMKIKEFGLYKSEPEKGMNSYTALKIVKLN